MSKKNKFFSLVLISLTTLTVLLSSCDGDASGRGATLLFKSGFEEGVFLEPAHADEGGVWYQDLNGSDVEGFSFPVSLWGAKGSFQVMVDAEHDASEYIRNRLITTEGHDGKPSRVISSAILKADRPWTQDPYIVVGPKKDGDLYLSYWLKLPKDLAGVLGDDGWCTFFEWKSRGDYRIAAYVYLEESKPYWYLHGDNEANPKVEVPYDEYWYRENREIKVPEGEWFHVEFFWHRSKSNDGRFWWAVDGKVVADYHGQTKIKEPMNAIMLFTVYADKYPLTQLVDDIEIWDGFPCGEGKSCHDKH